MNWEEAEQKNKIPKIGNYCNVNYDGRLMLARIEKVNEPAQTFDIKTISGNGMYNISFDRFKYVEPPSTKIVNIVNEKFGLNLLTVDSFAMDEMIVKILKEYGIV